MAPQPANEVSMLQETELESLTVQEQPPSSYSRKGRGVAVARIVAAVSLVLALVVNIHSLPRDQVGKLSEFEPRGVTILSEEPTAAKDVTKEEDLCKDEPQLIMSKVLHNNLGGKGPGTGKEGLVFEGVYQDVDGEKQDIEFHVNLAENSDEFQVAWPNMMGLHGKFMSINLKEATKVTVNMKATKPGETDAITLPVVDLSFFDLDKHKEGNEEFVKVKDFYSVLEYEGTEIEEEDTGHWTKFQATVKGTGADNPKNPLNLTEQQLKRAFTVEFHDFNIAKVTLGSLEPSGTHGRRFDFIGKPALKCAMGVDHEKVSMKVKAQPQCCIVKLMSFGLCCVDEKDKQFYHFMCDPVEKEDA